LAAAAAAAGAKVIDLSADLRLDDAAIYERWYGVSHPQPGLLPVVYGLPELNRAAITGSSVVANPGCYATSLILGLHPLMGEGCLLDGSPIIADAKSGVSGAGRTPKTHTLFSEVAGNFSPYKIGRAHRHIAEVEQVLGLDGDRLIFSPHLLPVDRGILSTLYVQTGDPAAAAEAIRAAYADEALIDVLPPGELATIAHVSRTPRAALSLTPANATTLIVTVAIDNLLKGAASQAVQNFNLMHALPETEGLL
jgi:N-acetyl-gamma-glutamyl-phosphate reductase